MIQRGDDPSIEVQEMLICLGYFNLDSYLKQDMD